MLKIACIPAFNEEDIIGKIIKETLKHVDKTIVCDDGSEDNTAQEASKSGAVVLIHKKNQGKGAALKSLFEKAKEMQADIIITIDGDGQFLPEEIPKLIQPIQDGTADVVIGNRFSNTKEIPRYRKTGNRILDKFARLASDLPFEDTQSGFRAYSKKAIKQINFRSDGFASDAEILIDAASKGLKITEREVRVLYNIGRKTSTKGPVAHFSEVIGSIIRLVAIRHPLRYLGIPGFVLVIFGLIFSMIVISIFNETRYFSIPSTLVALGSLVIGIILMMMSVVLYSISNVLKKVE